MLILSDYAREIASRLRHAFYREKPSAIDLIFIQADRELSEPKVSEISRRTFWATVRGYCEQSDILLEEPDNRSLLQLMLAIKIAVAAREKAPAAEKK